MSWPSGAMADESAGGEGAAMRYAAPLKSINNFTIATRLLSSAMCSKPFGNAR